MDKPKCTTLGWLAFEEHLTIAKGIGWDKDQMIRRIGHNCPFLCKDCPIKCQKVEFGEVTYGKECPLTKGNMKCWDRQGEWYRKKSRKSKGQQALIDKIKEVWGE